MKSSRAIPLIGIAIGLVLGGYAIFSGLRVQQGVFADSAANGAQLGGSGLGSLITLAGSAFMLWRQGRMSPANMAETGMLTGLLALCIGRGDTVGIAKINDLATHFAGQPRPDPTPLPTNKDDLLGWLKNNGSDLLRDLFKAEMSKLPGPAAPPAQPPVT